MKIDPYYQRRRCSTMTLDFGNIRFMRILAVVLKIYLNFPYIMSTPIYYVYTYLTLFSLSSSIVLFTTVIYHWLQRRVVKCGLAEMWQADQRNVIRRVFGIRGKTAIFRRRYIVGILTNKANISIQYYLVPYRLYLFIYKIYQPT